MHATPTPTICKLMQGNYGNTINLAKISQLGEAPASSLGVHTAFSAAAARPKAVSERAGRCDPESCHRALAHSQETACLELMSNNVTRRVETPGYLPVPLPDCPASEGCGWLAEARNPYPRVLHAATVSRSATLCFCSSSKPTCNRRGGVTASLLEKPAPAKMANKGIMGKR